MSALLLEVEGLVGRGRFGRERSKCLHSVMPDLNGANSSACLVGWHTVKGVKKQKQNKNEFVN